MISFFAPESWAWAGSDWQYHRREQVVSDLVAVEIQADDPEAMARRWSLALGEPISEKGTMIVLSDATIRFTPADDGRGDGLAAADLVATDRGRVGEALELCGFRFNLV